MGILIKGVILSVAGIVVIYKAFNPTKLTFNKDRINLEKAKKMKPLFFCCGVVAILCGIYLMFLPIM